MPTRNHYIIIAAVLVFGATFVIITNLPRPTCGFQNCHGLDLSCGSPIQCELVYQYGDNCRRFARCTYDGGIAGIGGSCQLIKENMFEECKACITKCLQDFGIDDIRSFDCEYRCTL